MISTPSAAAKSASNAGSPTLSKGASSASGQTARAARADRAGSVAGQDEQADASGKRFAWRLGFVAALLGLMRRTNAASKSASKVSKFVLLACCSALVVIASSLGWLAYDVRNVHEYVRNQKALEEAVRPMTARSLQIDAAYSDHSVNKIRNEVGACIAAESGLEPSALLNTVARSQALKCLLALMSRHQAAPAASGAIGAAAMSIGKISLPAAPALAHDYVSDLLLLEEIMDRIEAGEMEITRDLWREMHVTLKRARGLMAADLQMQDRHAQIGRDVAASWVARRIGLEITADDSVYGLKAYASELMAKMRALRTKLPGQ